MCLLKYEKHLICENVHQNVDTFNENIYGLNFSPHLIVCPPLHTHTHICTHAHTHTHTHTNVAHFCMAGHLCPIDRFLPSPGLLSHSELRVNSKLTSSSSVWSIQNLFVRQITASSIPLMTDCRSESRDLIGLHNHREWVAGWGRGTVSFVCISNTLWVCPCAHSYYICTNVTHVSTVQLFRCCMKHIMHVVWVETVSLAVTKIWSHQKPKQTF